jgi:hypothetical protein
MGPSLGFWGAPTEDQNFLLGPLRVDLVWIFQGAPALRPPLPAYLAPRKLTQKV